MINYFRTFLFLCAFFGMTSIGYAAGEWGYTEKDGPNHWGDMDPKNALCKDGKNQTPIDIVPDYRARLPSLQTSYSVLGNSIINNGHTIQVNFPKGNFLNVDKQKYTLLQVHFHTPSENHLRGKSFPLEAHFVHKDDKGNLGVLAVFYEEGRSNSGLATIWMEMPKKKGETKPLLNGFAANSILPASKDYIYFNGSLTTPPCSEGVSWYVLKEVQKVGKEQVKAFLDVMKHPNNRTLQPVNSRKILE